MMKIKGKNIIFCLLLFVNCTAEVKKSAAYATILIGEKFSEEEKKELKKYDDSDFEKILRY